VGVGTPAVSPRAARLEEICMGAKIDAADTSSTGLDSNLAAALACLLGFLSGILFLVIELVIEKDSQFVRFHALQSTMVFLVIFVATVVTNTLWAIPFIGWLMSILLNMLLVPLTLILWLVLMFKAYSGERFKLPILGDLAEQS
jgi:uncharacterized membrane protein